MNAVVAETTQIKATDKVLDAGYGVGGTSIYTAKHIGVQVTGLSLSPRQAEQATSFAKKMGWQIKLPFVL